MRLLYVNILYNIYIMFASFNSIHSYNPPLVPLVPPILSFVTVTGTYQKNTNIYTATVADIPNYDIYTITENSSFTVVNDISVNIMFYAVGGGGGPGYVAYPGYVAGGGGSGGIVNGNVILNNGTYSVIVGNGGIRPTSYETPSNNTGNPTYIDITGFPRAGGGGNGGDGVFINNASSTYSLGKNAPASGGGSGGGGGCHLTTATYRTGGTATNLPNTSTTNVKTTFTFGEAYQPNPHITANRAGSVGCDTTIITNVGIENGRGGGAGGTAPVNGNTYGNGITISCSSITQLYWDSVIGLGGASLIGWTKNTKDNTGDGGIGGLQGQTSAGKRGVFIMAVPKPNFTCLDITSMGITIPTGGDVAHLNQCWFRTSNLSKQYLFYKSSTSYACGIDANGNPFAEYNGTTVTITTINVADNVWHHMAMVCVPNSTVTRILIDGSIASSTIATTSLGALTSINIFNDGNTNQFIGQVYNIRSINLNATALYTSSITNETIAKDRRLIYSRPFANYNTARVVNTSTTPELVSSRIMTSIPCQDLDNNNIKNYNRTGSSYYTTIVPTGTGYGMISIPYSKFQP